MSNTKNQAIYFMVQIIAKCILKKDYLELQNWQQHRVVIMVTKGKDFKDLKLRQGGLKWEREWKHLSVKSFKEEF